jgi:hypothetical protein
MYPCMYVHTYVCKHVCAYACMHAYDHVYTCNTFVHVRVIGGYCVGSGAVCFRVTGFANLGYLQCMYTDGLNAPEEWLT